MIRSIQWISTAIAMTWIVLTSQTASAGFFLGSISAHFENPKLTGNVLQPTTPYDNTATAQYSAYESGSTAVFRWGGPGYSLLNFFPNQDVQVFNDEPFNLGTITYYNGTSELNALVFGVDLVLDFVGNPAVDSLRIPVSIGTTSNIGDANANADYITFGGSLPVSFFAYEGFGATANLMGEIVGDPWFNLLDITLEDSITLYTGPDPQGSVPYDPSQYTKYENIGITGGFVANTPSTVPEPASAILLGLGTLGVLLQTQLRRRK